MQQLAAAGGTPPYSWVQSGLPPGLALDHGTGTISGKPTAAGTSSIMVAVTDAHATAASLTLTLVVYPSFASPPEVTSISPISGPPGGGNTVTVEGRHLATATEVRFGDTPATALNVETDTSLTVTAPPGTTGTVVPITVTNPVGTSTTGPSDNYTYTSPRTPTIAGLSQVEGLAAGGAVIDVTGTNLAAVTTVRFGAVQAVFFNVVSSTSLLVTTPAASPGTVDVTASSRAGTSPSSDADRYTYIGDLSATRWIPTPFNPATITIDNNGDLFMSVADGNAIYVETPNGAISRYAGTGTAGYNGDNIPATQAELNAPGDMTFDAAGNLYIADQFNGRIRRVDRNTGIITTIAGIGRTGVSGMGGPAGSAGIGNPVTLLFSRNGDLYFSSRNYQVVCRIAADNGVLSSASRITIYAGTLLQPTPPLGDGGPATQGHLWMPAGLAMDPAGNLYIADDWDGRVRKVTPPSQGQIITTIAGGGIVDTSPTPQVALAAFLINPGHLNFDPFGNLYISELNSDRVDRLTPSGMIYTVVGGAPGPGDGNPPETAELGPVSSMAFVPSSVAGAAAGGTLYVCDVFNKRIAVVS
jgi:sugar lactone lactonase YvrE